MRDAPATLEQPHIASLVEQMLEDPTGPQNDALYEWRIRLEDSASSAAARDTNYQRLTRFAPRDILHLKVVEDCPSRPIGDS